MTLLRQFLHNVSPGPDHEPDHPGLRVTASPPVRLIAFYLPQFHAIPENDEWWGKGFTEWTNVTKAIPRFEGHYQPRLPGDLGFYNLAQPDVLRRQADLARRYGVGGFCFHHYWFGGKRLLHTPMDILLAHRDIDLPFCINWANENWTRHWDGHDRALLIAQKHSPEDDLAFAASIEPLFRDPRYIRIDGRPLLMLYRPGILPDAAATVRRWRAHFVNVGLGNPYIVMTQAFGDEDPAKYGMDAAAGFPPFWGRDACPRLEGSLNLFDEEFRGEVMDYAAMAQSTIAKYETGAKVFPGVCPSWDNQARQPGRGVCFTDASPNTYGHWLSAACQKAMRASNPDERLVFINAWNEWAEGAYLEPDRHYGYAYLAETARVLNALTPPTENVSRAVAQEYEPSIDVASLISERLRAQVRRAVRRTLRRGTNRAADAVEKIAQMIRRI